MTDAGISTEFSKIFMQFMRYSDNFEGNREIMRNRDLNYDNGNNRESCQSVVDVNMRLYDKNILMKYGREGGRKICFAALVIMDVHSTQNEDIFVHSKSLNT